VTSRPSDGLRPATLAGSFDLGISVQLVGADQKLAVRDVSQ
jgi:hypothetical protein